MVVAVEEEEEIQAEPVELVTRHQLHHHKEAMGQMGLVQALAVAAVALAGLGLA
jgi:hypothetical protein